MCFEHNIFHDDQKDNIYEQVSLWTIPRNIVGCYQDRNPSQTFLWNDFNLKRFQEIVSAGVIS